MSGGDGAATENAVLGRLLRDMRETAGLPLEHVAAVLTLPPERIAAYESGAAPLPLAVFIAISEMADIPIDIAAEAALTHLDRLHYPEEPETDP